MSSATIDAAIATRWKQQSLDSLFRNFWESPGERRYFPLNDTEARPNTPMPYCVYEKGTPILNTRTTGMSCNSGGEIEYWTVPISFRLHANTPARGQKNFGRTGKDILKELVGQSEPDGSGVLKAFDNYTGQLEMGGNDRHIQTVTGPDFHTREDDDVWVWVLQFDIQFERNRKKRGVG